jgi:hypothetical protein
LAGGRRDIHGVERIGLGIQIGGAVEVDPVRREAGNDQVIVRAANRFDAQQWNLLSGRSVSAPTVGARGSVDLREGRDRAGGGKESEKTLTGPMVVSMLDVILTRVTAKLNVRTNDSSLGKNTIADPSSLSQSVVECVPVGDKLEVVQVIQDIPNVLRRPAGIDRTHHAEHVVRLACRDREDPQIVAQP